MVSSISDSLKFGRIVGILFASIDFPEPGGPISKILWEPAAAISIALLATCCPITSEKLISSALWIVLILFILFLRMGFLSNK